MRYEDSGSICSYSDYIDELEDEIAEKDKEIERVKEERKIATRSLQNINRYLSNEEHVDSSWIKDEIQMSASNSVAEVAKYKNNEKHLSHQISQAKELIKEMRKALIAANEHFYKWDTDADILIKETLKENTDKIKALLGEG